MQQNGTFDDSFIQRKENKKKKAVKQNTLDEFIEDKNEYGEEGKVE
jgi:hypothetical protein